MCIGILLNLGACIFGFYSFWIKIGALIVTYTILLVLYCNYSRYNVPQNPILIIKAPTSTLSPYLMKLPFGALQCLALHDSRCGGVGQCLSPVLS